MTLHQTTHRATGTALAGTTGVHVLHSQHFHASLLRALFEAQDIDPGAILADAVEACSSGIAAPPPITAAAGEWGWVTERFRRAGMGRLVLDGVGVRTQGTAVLHGSHFATAWRARYAPPREPVCAVPAALIGRLLSEAAGEDRSVRETHCVAQGAEACSFEIAPAGAARGAGAVERPSSLADAGMENAGEGESSLFGAMLQAEHDGIIRAPGGPFGALPADFHAAVCRLFEVEVPRIRGAKFGSLPGILLTEAAHWNGFRLFGEILASREWREQVQPGLEEEVDGVKALLDVPERLGWGAWEVCSFVAGERLLVRVHDSYEAAAHERLFGRSTEPRCVVARGAAAAVMNVLYRSEPGFDGELTTSRYNALFRSPHSFRAVETRCRAQGDPFCELVANPLTV